MWRGGGSVVVLGMGNDVYGELTALAVEQHGVFTRRHVIDAGGSLAWLEHQVKAGKVRRLRYGAYCFAGAPIPWRGELLAAVWAGGPRGRASHRSAAALHGLVGGREDLVEIMCPNWRRARHGGLVVHETKAYDAVDTMVVDGITCTAPARTLLDLGAVLPPARVEYALDQALRTGLVTLASLDALLRRSGRRGRNGTGVLRKLVANRAPGRVAESPQERRMVRMLMAHGLPEPVLQYEIRDADGGFIARVDAAYPQWRIAVEYDSDEFHSGAQAAQRDNDRRRAMRRVSWEHVSVRSADLARGCVDVVRTIKAIRDDRTRSTVNNRPYPPVIDGKTRGWPG